MGHKFNVCVLVRSNICGCKSKVGCGRKKHIASSTVVKVGNSMLIASIIIARICGHSICILEHDDSTLVDVVECSPVWIVVYLLYGSWNKIVTRR